MKAFIAPSERIAMRVGALVEGSFADAEQCTLVTFPDGSGVSETRAAYNQKRKRVAVRMHPDGRFAIVMSLAARTKFLAWRDQLLARRAAGTATPDEAEVADLPAEEDLDETWPA